MALRLVAQEAGWPNVMRQTIAFPGGPMCSLFCIIILWHVIFPLSNLCLLGETLCLLLQWQHSEECERTLRQLNGNLFLCFLFPVLLNMLPALPLLILFPPCSKKYTVHWKDTFKALSCHPVFPHQTLRIKQTQFFNMLYVEEHQLIKPMHLFTKPVVCILVSQWTPFCVSAKVTPTKCIIAWPCVPMVSPLSEYVHWIICRHCQTSVTGLNNGHDHF